MSYLLIHGDARRIALTDQSVHCVVTSPPYWGLRDYGVFSQLGLEKTPDEYVAAMVEVFREVHRILRDDGTCWVNMGDSYAASIKTTGRNDNGQRVAAPESWNCRYEYERTKIKTSGLKPKDLCMIPARLALALQADGWYLRSDIIWAKPNPMPESVTDRPTKSHEYMFLLSKSERYYFDQEAVREENSKTSHTGGIYVNEWKYAPLKSGSETSGMKIGVPIPRNGRNIRSVWTIPTESYPGAHFATFPRKLVEPCVKAGTSEKGVCPVCGKPWEREVEVTDEYAIASGLIKKSSGGDYSWKRAGLDCVHGKGTNPSSLPPKNKTLAWHPSCTHATEPIPATVFDPFCGSGTTGVVALAHGRRFIGVDLSKEYLGLAKRRIERPHAAVPRPGRKENHPLFDGGGKP